MEWKPIGYCYTYHLGQYHIDFAVCGVTRQETMAVGWNLYISHFFCTRIPSGGFIQRSWVAVISMWCKNHIHYSKNPWLRNISTTYQVNFVHVFMVPEEWWDPGTKIASYDWSCNHVFLSIYHKYHFQGAAHLSNKWHNGHFLFHY